MVEVIKYNTRETSIETVTYKRHPVYSHIFCGDNGTIYSILRNHSFLSGTITKKGYVRVCLKRPIIKYAHRLILETFIGKSNLTIDHINGIKTDNRLCNLEYVTNAENLRRSMENGRSWEKISGSKNSQSKINEDIAKKIKQMRLEKMTCANISSEIGVSIHIVKAISSGKAWKNVAI